MSVGGRTLGAMETHISALGTIMGIWAHPDDEAYLSSGLMAAARRRGDRVVVVTATAGEHGTDDPATWPPASDRAVSSSASNRRPRMN